MTEEQRDALVAHTNRSKAQTEFLFDLMGSFAILLTLEEKIKNNFIPYCPGTQEEVNQILLMGNGSGWFNLNILR